MCSLFRHNPPTLEEKRICIDSLLNSVTFARAGQLRQLLFWLADRALAGGDPPTEFEVATQALGRPATFDPQSDSLVRKEMTRLRAKIRAYNQSEGASDPVWLRCDDGYRVTFQRSQVRSAGCSGKSELPRILVLFPPVSKNSDEESVFREIFFKLSDQEQVEVISWTTTLSFAGRIGDVRDFAAEAGADQLVEGVILQSVGEERSLILWLTDGASGRTRKLAKIAFEDIELSSLTVSQKVVNLLLSPNRE